MDSVLVRFEDGKLNPKATFTALAAFSLGSMVLAYMNFTVAPWLVVGRRMGVKVLMYLKFRNRGEFRICCVLVRFEDGKLNPKATFTALAAFLDLPYTQSMTYCSLKGEIDPEWRKYSKQYRSASLA